MTARIRLAVDIGGTFTDLVLTLPDRTISTKLLTTHEAPDHAVIAALVDGRLVKGFEARTQPEKLAQATLYLPTRRAGRMAREIFLDELRADAAVLPRAGAAASASVARRTNASVRVRVVM